MEQVYLSSKESLVNEAAGDDVDNVVKTNQVFHKFHQIVNEYLNGEDVEQPDGSIQNILGSYSLAAYLDHAIPHGKDEIVANLLLQCNSALQETLQITNTSCYVHEEAAAGVVQLIQMRLSSLYPKYSTQGFEALAACPPTVYISPLCIPLLGTIITRKLGFPSSYVKVLKMSDSNLVKLEKSLKEDLAAKRVPVMIISSIGSHHTGLVDNLVAVKNLAQRYNMWLHLEGHLISKMSLFPHPKEGLLIADSLHLDLRQWLGVPSLPFVTVYRQCEVALQRSAFLTPASCSSFNVVPLWFAFQTYGVSGVRDRFKDALDLSRALVDHLDTYPSIVVLSHTLKETENFATYLASESPVDSEVAAEDQVEEAEEFIVQKSETGKEESTEDGTESIEVSVASNAETISHDELTDEDKSVAWTLLETVCPVVVFRYKPVAEENEQLAPNVLDDLNIWLAQILERSCEEVHVDILDVDRCGYALRFSPYDNQIFPTADDILRFFECFQQQIEILNATVTHKSTLIRIVEKSQELQLVELSGWAGLGGVRYLPAAWRSDDMNQLPDQAKEEINKMNRQLVATLKLTDSAFSLGEGKDGLACIRFGMVVAETDVPALANLVRQTGQEIETSTHELETMAVMVRKGIEEAQAELKRETEQQLWQEGLLRHIPVVGSLVNYFLPTQKTVRIHGYVLATASEDAEKTEQNIAAQESLAEESAPPVSQVAPEVISVADQVVQEAAAAGVESEKMDSLAEVVIAAEQVSPEAVDPASDEVVAALGQEAVTPQELVDVVVGSDPAAVEAVVPEPELVANEAEQVAAIQVDPAQQSSPVLEEVVEASQAEAQVADGSVEPAPEVGGIATALEATGKEDVPVQEAVAVAVESRSEPDVLIEDGAPAIEDTLVIPEPEAVADLGAPVPEAQDVQTTVAESEVAVGVEALAEEVTTEKSEPVADVSSEENATTLQDVAGAAVAEPEAMTSDQVAEAVAPKEESRPSDVSEAVVPEIEPAAEETVVVEEVAILQSEPSLPAEAATENESGSSDTDLSTAQVAEIITSETETALKVQLVAEEVATVATEPALPAEAAMGNESSRDVVAQTDAPATQVAESALLAGAPVESESSSEAVAQVDASAGEAIETSVPEPAVVEVKAVAEEVNTAVESVPELIAEAPAESESSPDVQIDAPAGEAIGTIVPEVAAQAEVVAEEVTAVESVPELIAEAPAEIGSNQDVFAVPEPVAEPVAEVSCQEGDAASDAVVDATGTKPEAEANLDAPDQEAVVLEGEHSSEVIVELDAPLAKVPEAVVSEPEAEHVPVVSTEVVAEPERSLEMEWQVEVENSVPAPDTVAEETAPVPATMAEELASVTATVVEETVSQVVNATVAQVLHPDDPTETKNGAAGLELTGPPTEAIEDPIVPVIESFPLGARPKMGDALIEQRIDSIDLATELSVESKDSGCESVPESDDPLIEMPSNIENQITDAAAAAEPAADLVTGTIDLVNPDTLSNSTDDFSSVADPSSSHQETPGVKHVNEEIQNFNNDIAAFRLKMTNAAFFNGESSPNSAYDDGDLSDLGNYVRRKRYDSQVSKEELDNMAALVQKGIEEAQAELQREMDNRLWQEGLLRHIPLVGPLVNYFSPLRKADIKGRCLNLQSGRVEKSDVVTYASSAASETDHE